MFDSRHERPHPFTALGKWGSRIFLDRYFSLVLFCLACAVTACEWEVKGAVFFASAVCLALVVCDDILAALLPFLLLCTFVTNCYDSAALFLPYTPMIIPVFGSFLFHFIVYRQPLRAGSTLWGHIAVAVAITLGGLGTITASEYFSGSAIYHTLFLGLGMLGGYLLFKSQMGMKRDYDVRQRLLTTFYIAGMFAAFMILYFLLEKRTTDGILAPLTTLQCANNLSTILMFALPCPFFFASKNRMHWISALVMFFCLLYSGSRAGMLLGTAELLLCLVVTALWDRPRRFFYVCTLAAVVSLAVFYHEEVFDLLATYHLYPLEDAARRGLIERSFSAFRSSPVFGQGLGYRGNSDLYSPVRGALPWYHMMIPQIVGSLGLLGILAYLIQALSQGVAAVTSISKSRGAERGLVITVILSYVGILMMSQVNPGLFCPLPSAMMAGMLFATIDGENGLAPIAYLRENRNRK